MTYDDINDIKIIQFIQNGLLEENMEVSKESSSHKLKTSIPSLFMIFKTHGFK